MRYTEIVKKLIGHIEPVGETNEDNKRYKNLMEMCELANDLVSEIDKVAYNNQFANEFSRKRAANYAKNFLTNTIGIAQ